MLERIDMKMVNYILSLKKSTYFVCLVVGSEVGKFCAPWLALNRMETLRS